MGDRWGELDYDDPEPQSYDEWLDEYLYFNDDRSDEDR